MLDREVVEQVASADVGGRLGNQLSPLHGLAVPIRSAINAHFDTTKFGGRRRVLVASVHIKVTRGVLATVYILSRFMKQMLRGEL